MNRICTICARAGSKGVKNKNIKILHGKPLIAHTINQAINSGLFEFIAVSSDSEEILNIAKSSGVDFCIKRPAKLPVIQHCALEVEKLTGKRFDTYVDLDATSPLRTLQDIVNAVELLESTSSGNVITAAPSRRSPYFNLVEEDKDGIVRLSKSSNNAVNRRQDSPECYDMNASIYVWERGSLMNNESIFNDYTRMYVMPEERSQDIDSDLDFLIVKTIMENSL
jgi:CMP-N,N'-diacetyllegionaminic acid synthase